MDLLCDEFSVVFLSSGGQDGGRQGGGGGGVMETGLRLDVVEFTFLRDLLKNIAQKVWRKVLNSH